MNIKATISYALGSLVLIACYIGYMEFVKYSGFLDGYITDYDLKMRVIFQVMVLPLFFLSLYSFYLGKIAGKQNISKKLKVCIVVLLGWLIIFLLVNQFVYHSFDHGQGG